MRCAIVPLSGDHAQHDLSTGGALRPEDGPLGLKGGKDNKGALPTPVVGQEHLAEGDMARLVPRRISSLGVPHTSRSRWPSFFFFVSR